MTENQERLALDDHCYTNWWGTYTGQTDIISMGSTLLDSDPDYIGVLGGKYEPDLFIALFNIPFEYFAMTKKNFNNLDDTKEHLQNLMSSLDMIKVLKKAKYDSIIFPNSLKYDGNFDISKI